MVVYEKSRKNRGSLIFLKVIVASLICEGSHGESPNKKATDDYRTIFMNDGGPVRIICPVSKVKKNNKIVESKSPGNSRFLARPTGVRCAEGEIYEIGFIVDSTSLSTMSAVTRFTRVIEVCHNVHIGHTIYAHAKILPVGRKESIGRARFKKGTLFKGIPMDNVYRKITQRQTLARILKSPRLALEYLPIQGSFFFARGHLVAKADFAGKLNQHGTFMYANAVPMWQNINGGNWKIMEMNVRSLGIKRNLTLDVWVGSIGILSLKDKKKKNRKIYLHVRNKVRAVPVPKILFKVVYDRSKKSGVVFLTANNPYLTHLPPDYSVCPDVCNLMSYLTWKPTLATHGFSYCCNIDDFRKAFPNIPNFMTKSLLV